MAVINAINNACGVRIYELFASPDKVKDGIEKLAKGEKIQPPKNKGKPDSEDLKNAEEFALSLAKRMNTHQE